MGRPRKWESDAERMRALRNGREELEPGEAELVVEAIVVEPQPRALAPFPRNRAAPPLEQYVAEAREAARIVGEGIAKRKLPSASTSNGNVASPMASEDTEARVAKAEAYARWRWQGYADGEIASL